MNKLIYKRHNTRKLRYSASNFLFVVDKENNVEAYSYNWWRFVAICPVSGLLIFNNTTYSESTSGHQSHAKSCLRDLKLGIDIELNNTVLTLPATDYLFMNVFKDEINGIDYEINELTNLINVKGSHKVTNKKREQKIHLLIQKKSRILQIINKYNEKVRYLV